MMHGQKNIKCRTVNNTVLNIWVQQNMGNLTTSSQEGFYTCELLYGYQQLNGPNACYTVCSPI